MLVLQALYINQVTVLKIINKCLDVTLLSVNRVFNGVIGFVVQTDVRQTVIVTISKSRHSALVQDRTGTVKLIQKELINILFNLPIPITGIVGRLYMLM